MVPIITAPPKSHQVAEAIRREITAGKLEPGDRLLTVRQFAARFQVSNQVVQSAFGILSQDGLIESHVGRGTFVAHLPSDQTRRSVVMILDGTRDPHTRLPVLLSAELQQRRLLSLLLDTRMTADGHAQDEIRQLLQSCPRALILDAYSLFNPELLDYLSPRTHLIVVKRHEMELPGSPIFYALIDYVKVGRLAGQYLLECGCQRIAMLNFERRPRWTSDLLAHGLEQALSEAGAAPCRFLDHLTPPEELTQMLATEPADGIFCHADHIYDRVKRATRQLGLRQGEDFHAVGFGNTPWAEAFGITSIDPHEDEIARIVATHLDEGFTGGRHIIQPTLHQR